MNTILKQWYENQNQVTQASLKAFVLVKSGINKGDWFYDSITDQFWVHNGEVEPTSNCLKVKSIVQKSPNN